jgi:hypothetical protein
MFATTFRLRVLAVAAATLALPVSAWAGGTTAATTDGTDCSCPSTCAAQQHFGNLAKADLALSQPPSPKTSFAEGCLGNLDSFHITSYFNPNIVSSLIQNLEKQILNEACSTLTNTMNNEVSQGNQILNFALDPQQLEQDALNNVSNSVLSAEQNALDNATNPASNAVGQYVSEAGNYENDVGADAGNAVSGNWINNLY